MNSINLNSWNPTGAELKAKICTVGDPDVICICETHLSGNELIDIPGYRCYSFPRQAPTGKKSGGVAMLIRSSLFAEYSVREVSKDLDGILGVQLTHKASESITLITSNYLPPPNSEFGRDPEGFFGRLLSLNYDYHDCDMLLSCGDLNARIGDLQECDGMSICNRESVDAVVNTHGKCLMDFLNDSVSCVLNGRLHPATYTYHGATGSSTVDYAIVPCDLLNKVWSFTVLNVEELVNDEGWGQLVADGSRIPDHDLLQIVIETAGSQVADFVKGLGAPRPTSVKSTPRTFYSEFMKNDRIRRVLREN